MRPGAPPLVLASGSAARRDLLQAAGLAFTVVRPEVDEAAIKRRMRPQGAHAAALALACAKAASIPDTGALVVGAAQILVCEGEWLDKPPDQAAARAQLCRLRGRQHTLVTAVVCWRAGEVLWRHVACPALRMRAFSDRFLDAYLAAEGDAILGSVGAYRLEGLGIHVFDAIEGEQSAILGLPMVPLLDHLRACGVVMA